MSANTIAGDLMSTLITDILNTYFITKPFDLNVCEENAEAILARFAVKGKAKLFPHDA